MLTTPAFTLTVCVLSTFTTLVLGLRLGAFNAHVFGISKANKQDVMGILARIVVRYDIVLMLEIKDKSGQAIVKLLDRIQEDHGITMTMNISDRLGRTSSKEQYAFLYRADHGLSVLDAVHFDDGNETAQEDLFEREPFIVRFHAPSCNVTDFTLVALHTKPSKTVEELKALTQVIQFVQDTWHTTDIMVLGDLNADCRYVPKKAWPDIEIWQNPNFWWPIGDEVDTTVNANTDCAYDRFIITGMHLRDAVIAESAQTFDFQVTYGLNAVQALAVSDHFPIELTLLDQSQTEGQSPPTRDPSSNTKAPPPGAHPTGPSNSASGALSLTETLQQIWRTVVKKFFRWRSDSDL